LCPLFSNYAVNNYEYLYNKTFIATASVHFSYITDEEIEL